MAPSLRVAAQIRPYFILALDGGPATAFGLGFISTPRTKTCPSGPRVPGAPRFERVEAGKDKSRSFTPPDPFDRFGRTGPRIPLRSG